MPVKINIQIRHVGEGDNRRKILSLLLKELKRRVRKSTIFAERVDFEELHEFLRIPYGQHSQ